MRIVGCCWTPAINRLEIECQACEHRTWHRADRWRVKCGFCDQVGNLGEIREAYARRNEVVAQAKPSDDGS